MMYWDVVYLPPSDEFPRLQISKPATWHQHRNIQLRSQRLRFALLITIIILSSTVDGHRSHILLKVATIHHKATAEKLHYWWPLLRARGRGRVLSLRRSPSNVCVRYNNRAPASRECDWWLMISGMINGTVHVLKIEVGTACQQFLLSGLTYWTCFHLFLVVIGFRQWIQ